MATAIFTSAKGQSNAWGPMQKGSDVSLAHSTSTTHDQCRKEDILLRENRLFEECTHAFASTARQNCPDTTSPQLWSRPPQGWVKANVDASVNPTGGHQAIVVYLEMRMAIGLVVLCVLSGGALSY
ncbi:hypothetical protein V6N12_017402 [Hibiscus sabdariffa]|uniref:Uncharacterized protein n=1 Tax=Hibiscus sabdariffa TaxID=183260 RepID=A0ABR2CH55_9ROSI